MVACSTYRSLALMADAEKGMWNACGNLGGLKSCLFTVAPGCWVTSTNDNSSVACGVTVAVASWSLTVPVTAVAAGAGVPAPDGDSTILGVHGPELSCYREPGHDESCRASRRSSLMGYRRASPRAPGLPEARGRCAFHGSFKKIAPLLICC